jgi:hypothetical protein
MGHGLQGMFRVGRLGDIELFVPPAEIRQIRWVLEKK